MQKQSQQSEKKGGKEETKVWGAMSQHNATQITAQHILQNIHL